MNITQLLVVIAKKILGIKPIPSVGTSNEATRVKWLEKTLENKSDIVS